MIRNYREIDNMPRLRYSEQELYKAVEAVDLKAAKKLIDAGADVNKCNCGVVGFGSGALKDTALSLAFKTSNLEMIRLLIKAGIKRDFRVMPCDSKLAERVLDIISVSKGNLIETEMLHALNDNNKEQVESHIKVFKLKAD
jgi:mannose/fructose/N-acetylgalactosamine-specific phosphotransferase system component IIB